MSEIKDDETKEGTLPLEFLRGSIDDLIEYLQYKKEEGKTEFEVDDDGIRDNVYYVLSFK